MTRWNTIASEWKVNKLDVLNFTWTREDYIERHCFTFPGLLLTCVKSQKTKLGNLDEFQLSKDFSCLYSGIFKDDDYVFDLDEKSAFCKNTQHA